ncbi:late competence development ComFB family protein [Lysinibacillus sp. LZ02]|uniref:late competence development ComFB family protein n=1 Tax=Lysinibacillus sp. LZ02 TaxID=3420668 RepID=UPI003D35C49E
MEQLMLVNVTEEIVQGLVKFLLYGNEYQTFCHCEQCILDITAIALNALAPRYVTSSQWRDTVFREMNTPEHLEEINKQIIRAIHVIGSNPHHRSEPNK